MDQDKYKTSISYPCWLTIWCYWCAIVRRRARLSDHHSLNVQKVNAITHYFPTLLIQNVLTPGESWLLITRKYQKIEQTADWVYLVNIDPTWMCSCNTIERGNGMWLRLCVWETPGRNTCRIQLCCSCLWRLLRNRYNHRHNQNLCNIY